MNNKNAPTFIELLDSSRALAELTALTELLPGSALHDAIQYHLATPGSEARSALCLYASLALGLTPESAIRLAASVETLHNASLIQDDLQDSDEVRRGKPTIWKVFGHDIAINATDLLIASAFGLVASVGGRTVTRLVSTMHLAIARTLQGQTRDLSSDADISIEEAIAVARQKSGPLFSLGLELPLVLSGHHSFLDTAREAGAAFGIGYQIFDDIHDRFQDSEVGCSSNIACLLGSPNRSEFTSSGSAEDIAHHFLRQAASMAAALPEGCGEMLRDKCSELINELKREAA